MSRFFLAAGSISGFVAVALGAFAAHALKERLAPDLLTTWEVGVRYQMYHALALCAVAWAVSQFPSSSVSVAGWLFIAGTVIFSGSLYLMSLTGLRWLGAVTPVGGLCFLAGWLWLAWSVLRSS